MRLRISHAAILLAVAFHGVAFPESPRGIDSVPADPDATAETRRVLAYLAELSGDRSGTALVGQNCGHGSQIADESNPMGYRALVETLAERTGRYPAILGVDYEHDRIFTPTELARCNAILIAHWRAGGLVTINWSPHNPLANDETDIATRAGSWTDTRVRPDGTNAVHLQDLLDPSTKAGAAWRRKLGRVADALRELQDAGVVVLWRPLQEMNGFWFWWGNDGSPNAGDAYRALWREMRRYLTEERGLHNLLWVYAPCSFADRREKGVLPPEACYPGDDDVDVVAGTVYADSLRVADYETYRSFGKPVALAEYGSTIGGRKALAGNFDGNGYADRVLKDYPAIAYWVAWHDWDNGNGTSEHHALVSGTGAARLMVREDVITRDEIPLPAVPRR